MHIYKELIFCGDKPALDHFKKIAPKLVKGDWIYSKSDCICEYIAFDYVGNQVDQAEVLIYYGKDTWREGNIKVFNIVPLVKNELTIDEYNAVLDLFYEEIVIPNKEKLQGIRVIGSESDVFDPLKYISKVALEKLNKFCNGANKSTGSSHPSDEERWFDFICQTVDDNQVFDYDTLYRFLIDENYWGKKDPSFMGVIGHFAWDEKHAEELASEYDNYVRFLKYYKTKK